jgi:hypothetical protein
MCGTYVLYDYISLVHLYTLLDLDYKESLAPFQLRPNITNHAATYCPQSKTAGLESIL